MHPNSIPTQPPMPSIPNPPGLPHIKRPASEVNSLNIVTIGKVRTPLNSFPICVAGLAPRVGINWVDQGLPSPLHWSIGALPGQQLPHWGPSPPSQWGSLIWQEGEGGCSPTSTSNSSSGPNGLLPNRLPASLSHPLVSCNCNLPPPPHLLCPMHS